MGVRMSDVEKWTNDILAVAIIIATVGIAAGVSILITSQFESIRVGDTSIMIPEQFKLTAYTPMIGLLLTILTIMLVVGVVFGFIIPKLREGVRAGV
ncbi:MAG: hypothetical protein QXD83_06440 [Sulfolobales archaeon]